MHLDVRQLSAFYYETPLGAVTQRRLQAQIIAFWPRANGLAIAGFGFAAPLMRPLRRDAARLVQLMPAQQGVMLWPREGPNVSALVAAHDWPIQTSYLDRLVLAHGLENADQPHALLDECWRVLTPEGRLLVVAPNRAGMWARRDATPFGYGRPYSREQIETQLKEHGFDVLRTAGALFTPPSTSKFWARLGPIAERVGDKLDAQRLAGVLIVEAVKRVPAPRRGTRVPVFAPAPAPALGGLTPAPEPNGRRVSATLRAALLTKS